MGAWIETPSSVTVTAALCVAPHVGAWIETIGSMQSNDCIKSRPTWARGLKLRVNRQVVTVNRSRPTWARGLKHYGDISQELLDVAPHVGAWIETFTLATGQERGPSRPTWARGLKRSSDERGWRSHQSRPTWARGLKQTLAGRWNEMYGVAPHVGAWIETSLWR